jgi:SAM-dependent methyltransferase
VLDVACGVGRHATALAQRGYDVTGIDLSPTMVQRAQTQCLGAPRQPSFSAGDMLALEYDECFDAAYCVGSSFGFFDDQRNADVATRIHRALKDNGTFLLQVINRDHAIQSQPAMAWFEGDGCVCMEESSVNYITSRLNVKRTMIFDDGRQREIEYSVRLYSLHELGQLLHQSGFRILEVSGHQRTPGAFFGPSSRELIILAQKRGAEVIDLHEHADADD